MTHPSPDHDFTQQDAVALTDELGGLFRAGGTLGQVLAITREERDALYQLGHGFYQQGRYSEAFQAFSLLLTYDHLDPRNVMALAGAMQMLGRHADALQQYMTAGLMLLDDPTPMFHTAECLIALRRLPEAVESLQLAVALADDRHAAVKARAEALLEVVQGAAPAPAQ